MGAQRTGEKGCGLRSGRGVVCVRNGEAGKTRRIFGWSEFMININKERGEVGTWEVESRGLW